MYYLEYLLTLMQVMITQTILSPSTFLITSTFAKYLGLSMDASFYLVAEGHMTHTPDVITYSSVVTREIVCIALTMIMLHDMQVKAADALNVMAPIREEIWTVLSPDFVDDAGKSVIIVRSIYGLKNAGAAFRSHLAQYLWALEYQSCDADPDLWMKAEYRLDNKLEYNSYILCYVVGIICIHHDPYGVLNKLNGYVPVKPSSVESSDMYLSTKWKHMYLHDGIWAWSMSPSKYVQEALRICDEYVAKHM